MRKASPRQLLLKPFHQAPFLIVFPQKAFVEVKLTKDCRHIESNEKEMVNLLPALKFYLDQLFLKEMVDGTTAYRAIKLTIMAKLICWFPEGCHLGNS